MINPAETLRATSVQLRATSLQAAAAAIGTDPAWLDALINFETGGTYDPAIKNKFSSARGIIQITDAPAQDLGFADSLEAVTRYPDFHSQMMNVVVPYFRLQIRRHGPLDTKQKLFMAVFFPAAMKVPASTSFETIYRGLYPNESLFAREYDKFTRGNPGILTVQDYIDFVERRVKVNALVITSKKAFPILLVLAAGIGVWMISRRKAR